MPSARLRVRLLLMATTAEWLQVRQLVLCSAIPEWKHVVYIPGPHKQGGGGLFVRTFCTADAELSTMFGTCAMSNHIRVSPR